MTDPHFPFALVLEVKTTKMCDGVKNGLLHKLFEGSQSKAPHRLNLNDFLN